MMMIFFIFEQHLATTVLSRKIEVEFIINPIAGTKSKGIFKELIKQHLDLDVFSYDISYTRESGHAYELATQAIGKGKEYIIAVGGDGTINEVGKALIYESAALGIIPFGSGNGLARHLGISLKPISAIRAINHQVIKTIDAGSVNGYPFFCTAGVGFDAHVGRIFSMATKRGFSTYIKTVLKEFIRYKTDQYKISIDGKTTIEKEAFSITFANAAQYGNNAYIAPDADISDGKLNLTIIDKLPKLAGMRMGLQLFDKSINTSPFVNSYQMQEAVVSCPTANCFHLDGESLPLKGEGLAVSIIPKCLNVLVP